MTGPRGLLAAALVVGAMLVTATVPAAPRPRSTAVAPRVSPAPSASGFTGRWLLDASASDLGKGRRPPISREEVVRQDSAWVAVRSTTLRAVGDTLRLEYRYRTDGESVNTLMGQQVRTRGRRDGAALRFDSETRIVLLTLSVAERWTLSADGSGLTMERDSRSPLGDEHQRLVFRRAP